MRRLAAGSPPILRLLTPLVLALGALLAPVECGAVPGPHAIFADPEVLAALVSGGPFHHQRAGAVTNGERSEPRHHEPAAPVPQSTESLPADDATPAGVPTSAPLSAPAESTALVAVAGVGDPMPVVARGFPPTPEAVPLAEQAAPSVDPPPPRLLLA